MDEHDVTGVIHLAALQVPFVREDPVLGSRVNVTGTVNVLEAVRRRGDGMRPVVYASSIAALRRRRRPTRARSTASSSSPTRAPPRATSPTSACPHRPAPAHDLRPRPRPGADLGADRRDGRRRARRGVRDPVRRLAAAAVRGGRRRGVRARRARPQAEGASVHNLDGPVATSRRSSRRSRRRRRAPDITYGDGSAAVPAGGGLDVVHGPRRRPDRAAVRGGRGGGDRARSGEACSTAPSAAPSPTGHAAA